jgi:Phytanoyl-CoA dioxygenase (PhyH)
MEKGYRILRQAFDKSILDLVSRDFETVALQCKPENVFKTKNGDVKQIQCCQNFRVFSEVSKHIKDVLGYDGEVLNMQYFVKHPDYKITAPHQDGAYFDNTDDDILTFWIPLHDVDETTSTMFYVDWDGKREIIKHEDCGSNVRTRTGKTGMSQYTKEIPLEDFTPVRLNYGDCVVHNQFSVHYSNENSTQEPRIAITCIMKLNKLNVGDKVIKNESTWVKNDFDSWGRGEGIGEIVEPPFELGLGVDVRWPSGRCFEDRTQIKKV